ncbi:hypothetical protein J2X53_001284 [Pseudorhodobacter sp. 4114]|nr:hypothetical protein [Pseudorhodobacter sp. 4114]
MTRVGRGANDRLRIRFLLKHDPQRTFDQMTECACPASVMTAGRSEGSFANGVWF